MQEQLQSIISLTLLSPLVGGVLAGVLGKSIKPKGAHSIAITGVLLSFCCALIVMKWMLIDQVPPIDVDVYQWVSSGGMRIPVGILVDQLSAIMIVVVTFVSLLVHIYSIGYMADDPGYPRFFCYMSLFTFAMLTLVLANNIMLLFFGWEGVGVISYLLIGFWYERPSAAAGSLKAFLVNRVGDFGFLLGMALILYYVGSLNYHTVFSDVSKILTHSYPLFDWLNVSAIDLICFLLFIGAMGKSAQIPLHVWLPESMEGPTPISALIHAATMVTAGVYMVARFSPLYEASVSVRSIILILGATGALFLGLVGIVQQDIKRVVAYSTLSQLGYMMAANGVSAYPLAIFHLATHACFKAVLFLAAGSVIIGLHHQQNLFKMGGLRRVMPITAITFLLAALSLAAIPPFSGFYSKEAIIHAVSVSNISGSTYAYVCLLLGAMVTPIYIFRVYFLAFCGQPKQTEVKAHESPWQVTLPLILLAVPSVVLGGMLAKSIGAGLFGNSLQIGTLGQQNIAHVMHAFQHPWSMLLDAFTSLAFYFSLLGIFISWFVYLYRPSLPDILCSRFKIIYKILLAKYGFDWFNEHVLVKFTQFISKACYQIGDRTLIDKWIVNGVTAGGIRQISSYLRKLQTGYLYHYAFIMLIGMMVLLLYAL